MGDNSCSAAAELRCGRPRNRVGGELIGLACVILTIFPAAAHPQDSEWWLSLSAKLLVGWEVHRIIENARFANSDDELFGPSEMERQVTGIGYGIGPELAIGWRRWTVRGAIITSSHAFTGNGSSDNYYISADVGYGTLISGFVGGRALHAGYDDLDSSGLGEYDLSVIVVGARLHLQRSRSPWILDFNACAGTGGIGAIFDYTEALELPELVEIDLTVGYQPAQRPYQFEFGYYFWSHAEPAGNFVPSSTLLFDRIWQQYYPIWHGFMLRTRYWFGAK